MTCCPPNRPDHLIVYKKGLESQEALVLRSLLEGAGVSVWLTHEHMSTMNYAVGADLLIRRQDQIRADQLLENITVVPSVSPQMDMSDLTECHHCGATSVFPYVGDIPIWGGFVKTKAFAGSPWRQCLNCYKFFRVDSRRIMSNVPISLLWGGVLALTVYSVQILISWLSIVL